MIQPYLVVHNQIYKAIYLELWKMINTISGAEKFIIQVNAELCNVHQLFVLQVFQ